MPKLETKKDKIREQAAIGPWLRKMPDAEFLQNFESYGQYDWMVRTPSGKMGVIEMKCRDVPSTEYPSIFVSAIKIDTLVGLNAIIDGAVLCPAFSDGKVFSVSIKKLVDLPMAKMHRRKPRESGLVGPNDSEEGVYVPFSDMQLVGIMTKDELRIYNA